MVDLLKAWSVYGDGNGAADILYMDDIIFAETRGQAIAKSELLSESGDRRYCRAKRVPWADEYAEAGKIPTQAYLDHFWSVICDRCEYNAIQELTDGKAICEDCLETLREEAEEESK